MGHLALALSRHLAGGAAAVWVIVPASEARRQGFGTLGEFHAAAQAAHPLEVAHTPAPVWTRGVLATNDPQRADVALGLVVVERNDARLGAVLAQLLPTWSG
jgi:hypothetical protein